MYNGLKIVYSINGVGILDRYIQKNETRPTSYTTHKNKFKMAQNFYVRHKTIKTLKANIGSTISDIVHSNFFISPSKGNKRENKQLGLHQTKKFLHSKGNHQREKNTTHRMGEHIRRYI